MKKTLLTMGAFMLSISPMFGQVKEVPKFSSDAEKATWITEHPDEYRRLNGVMGTEEVTPHIFKSDSEKSAHIRENGTGHEQTILQGEPDFPKYIDTGDPEGDKVDYANRKDRWIEQNKERYEKLSNAPAENLTREQRLQKGEIIIRN